VHIDAAGLTQVAVGAVGGLASQGSERKFEFDLYLSERTVLEPSEVGLVAVHGTGTPLGDPIEVGALGQALTGSQSTHGGGGVRGGGHRVALASVKSCYGHTEGAAGLTGALLAVSSLQAQVGSSTDTSVASNTCLIEAIG